MVRRPAASAVLARKQASTNPVRGYAADNGYLIISYDNASRSAGLLSLQHFRLR